MQLLAVGKPFFFYSSVCMVSVPGSNHRTGNKRTWKSQNGAFVIRWDISFERGMWNRSNKPRTISFVLHADYIIIHTNSLHIIPFVPCTDQAFSLFKKASGQFSKGLKLQKERKKPLWKNPAVQLKLKEAVHMRWPEQLKYNPSNS